MLLPDGLPAYHTRKPVRLSTRSQGPEPEDEEFERSCAAMKRTIHRDLPGYSLIEGCVQVCTGAGASAA